MPSSEMILSLLRQGGTLTPSLLLAKEKLASEAIRKLVEKLGLEIVALRE